MQLINSCILRKCENQPLSLWDFEFAKSFNSKLGHDMTFIKYARKCGCQNQIRQTECNDPEVRATSQSTDAFDSLKLKISGQTDISSGSIFQSFQSEERYRDWAILRVSSSNFAEHSDAVAFHVLKRMFRSVTASSARFVTNSVCGRACR